jgi:hypothetical protein
MKEYPRLEYIQIEVVRGDLKYKYWSEWNGWINVYGDKLKIMTYPEIYTDRINADLNEWSYFRRQYKNIIGLIGPGRIFQYNQEK